MRELCYAAHFFVVNLDLLSLLQDLTYSHCCKQLRPMSTNLGKAPHTNSRAVQKNWRPSYYKKKEMMNLSSKITQEA